MNYYNHPKRKQKEVDAHNHALNSYGGINKIRDAVIELNQPIENVLLKGKQVGGHFSWIEANLVHEIQHYGCINWDVPILTVYDEFIVPADDWAGMVEEQMFSTMDCEVCTEYSILNMVKGA